MSIGVYGHLCVSMRVYGYLWVSRCLCATMSVYMGDYGYMIVHGCLWIFMGVHEYFEHLWVSMAIYNCI